jgi:hypothetical protein
MYASMSKVVAWDVGNSLTNNFITTLYEQEKE